MGTFVAAIDPGFKHTGIVVFDISTGVAVWEDAICISPKKGNDKDAYVSELDAAIINTTLTTAIDFFKKWKIERIAFELPSGGAKSSRAARALGIATCSCVAMYKILGCEHAYVTPRNVKLAATGDPFAEKDAIIKAMTALFPNIANYKKGSQEHIADAAAVGLTKQSWLLTGKGDGL